jgi:hypothetical protein
MGLFQRELQVMARRTYIREASPATFALVSLFVTFTNERQRVK